MDVIQKTIQVPPSHLISLELPADIATGDMAIVTINIASKAASEISILDLAGVLSDSQTFADNSVDSIRKMRDDW